MTKKSDNKNLYLNKEQEEENIPLTNIQISFIEKMESCNKTFRSTKEEIAAKYQDLIQFLKSNFENLKEEMINPEYFINRSTSKYYGAPNILQYFTDALFRGDIDQNTCVDFIDFLKEKFEQEEINEFIFANSHSTNIFCYIETYNPKELTKFLKKLNLDKEVLRKLLLIQDSNGNNIFDVYSRTNHYNQKEIDSIKGFQELVELLLSTAKEGNYQDDLNMLTSNHNKNKKIDILKSLLKHVKDEEFEDFVDFIYTLKTRYGLNDGAGYRQIYDIFFECRGGVYNRFSFFERFFKKSYNHKTKDFNVYTINEQLSYVIEKLGYDKNKIKQNLLFNQSQMSLLNSCVYLVRDKNFQDNLKSFKSLFSFCAEYFELSKNEIKDLLFSSKQYGGVAYKLLDNIPFESDDHDLDIDIDNVFYWIENVIYTHKFNSDDIVEFLSSDNMLYKIFKVSDNFYKNNSVHKLAYFINKFIWEEKINNYHVKKILLTEAQDTSYGTKRDIFEILGTKFSTQLIDKLSIDTKDKKELFIEKSDLYCRNFENNLNSLVNSSAKDQFAKIKKMLFNDDELINEFINIGCELDKWEFNAFVNECKRLVSDSDEM